MNIADRDDTLVVGKLSEAFTFAAGDDKQWNTADDDAIPAGSLIFAGTYKGNPAYNLVVLYDRSGRVIGFHEKDGKEAVDAGQIICAAVPAKGMLGETSNGTWVYYVEPENWSDETITQITKAGGVRGELFRVDDAKETTGERIVSDTQIIQLPQELPWIRLTNENTIADKPAE